MAFEADRVVVELIAKVDQFDQPVKQSASNFEASADRVAKSADRVEKGAMRMSAAQFKAAGGMAGLTAALKDGAAAGDNFARSTDKVVAGAQKTERSIRATQQATRNLGYQISDIGTQVSMGTSPFIILAQQGPQVANALDGAKGSVGRFASFLSGPYGAAVLGAVTILGVFLTKNRDTSDSVDDLVQKLKEHAEKTRDSGEAQRIFGGTIDGVNEGLRKNRELLDGLNDASKTSARRALEEGASWAIKAAGIREANLALLKQAEAQLLVLQGQSATSGSLRESGASAEQRFVAQRVADIKVAIAAAETALSEANKQIQEALSRRVVEMSDAASDPLQRIKEKYEGRNGLIEKARQRALAEGTVSTELRKQTEALKAQQQIEEDAARKRRQTGSGLSGRQISFDDAASIARGAGFKVTSAYRSTAHQAELYNDPSVNRPGNPVARPGTSAHEGINGKWALDIAFAPGLTPQSLKKLYGDQGVTLSAVYKEAGHFHIEGSRSQAAAAENAAAREAERQRRADKQHQDQIDKLLMTEVDVTIEVSKQRERTLDLGASILDAAAAEEALRHHVELVAAEMDEVNQFGGELIDQILNPDNWKNWGDTAKNVLHEIMLEIIKLGAINPLKNLLSGNDGLPTLVGTLGRLFGGGFDQQSFALTESSNAAALGLSSDFFRASGGPVGAGQAYVVGENGPETFVPSTSGMIIPAGGAPRPSNDRAASPYGGTGGDGGFRVEVVPSQYFDVRVSRIAGPMVAEGSIRAAAGGSMLAQRELGRNAMHRLE